MHPFSAAHLLPNLPAQRRALAAMARPLGRWRAALQASQQLPAQAGRRALGLAWLLLLLGLGACREPTARPPAAAQQLAYAPLPPALHQLLYPLPTNAQADARRLTAALSHWAGDSLAQLLLHSRLGSDYEQLQQPDSALRHLRLAWRLASPALRRRQPAEVIMLANDLGDLFAERALADSVLYYNQQFISTFRAARLDSTRNLRARPVQLPTNHHWLGGLELASTLANTGLLLRHAGHLPTAFRYYEQAAALYQQLQDPRGQLWAQCLLGEAYAEQGDEPRASATYEQALRTARALRQQGPDPPDLAGVLLDWYWPLLLRQPQHAAEARQLAEEVAQNIRRVLPPAQLAASLHYTVVMARLELLKAELSLRAGQSAAAELARAKQWLEQPIVRKQRTHQHSISVYDSPAAAESQLLGLQAWQQRATNPAASRQLLARAAALLPAPSTGYVWGGRYQVLAGYSLAMGEPAVAVRLLRPLTTLYQQQGNAFALSQVDELLTQAYAATGRYDSAYFYTRRAQALADTLRSARQFTALAATEARYHTREQVSQIQLLTERSRRAALRMWFAAAGAALLALALLAVALSWRATRRLNQQLAAQGALLQAQADRLGELDRAKNQFFANVSHELRTPLTLVLGPLSQALALAKAPDLRELLATSARHGQRLRALIDRILDLTKLEAGKLEAQPGPTRLGPLLWELLAGFEPLAAAGGVQLLGPVGLPEALTVSLDADKLSQILTNLLANALQHTPAGGQVSLTVTQPGPDQYALTVRDTGPGIAPAEQAHLFERFYQSPQRQARGGTGLGLALSRELATLLGGSLTVASVPGQGAAFTLALPAPRLPDAPPAPAIIANELVSSGLAARQAPAYPPLAARPRILLVEDQADLRAFVRGLLAPAYEVLEAVDGQQALEVLAREPVDLVASDAMMPRLSGLELLQQLKASSTHQGLPFLMITARADEAHRLTALATGVDDYLLKPFEAPELLARVGALLASRAVRQHYAAQLPGEAATPATPTPAPAATSAPAAPPPKAALQLTQWQALVASRLPDEHFGPVELAALLCLSERTLYRRLGELAGLTPAAWLRELRLAHARRLLEAGEFASVADVASAAGFGTAKYFSVCYAERFGRRPSDYFRVSL